MNKFHRHLIGAALTALGLSLSHTATLAADSGLTRAEVREDLKDARATNMMTPSGEIGDSADVLAARETFNALQTEVMASKQARQTAAASQTLDELVADLQARDDGGDEASALVGAD